MKSASELCHHRARFSVIVPVYNQAEQLVLCLAALEASEYRDFEVIVVDDGSTQPLQSSVSRHGFQYVRLEERGGPARARNRGASLARGEFLLFVDADVCVHTDTLTRLSETLAADPTVDAVIGAYDDAPADPGLISQYKNLFHHYTHIKSSGPIETFWSGCGAISRERFMAVGGFDDRRYHSPAIEDVELGTWMTRAGCRIVLDPRVRCKHLKRWTLLGLLRTDIFERGIPWVHLVHRSGAIPDTLNLKRQERLSVGLVWLAMICLSFGVLYPLGSFAASLAFGAVALLNVDLYQYFATKRSWLFALCVVPLHWMYFGYCGLCVIAGTLLFWLDEGPAAIHLPALQSTPSSS